MNKDTIMKEKVMKKIVNDLDIQLINATKNHGVMQFRKRSKLGIIIPFEPEFEHRNCEYILEEIKQQLELGKATHPNGFVVAFDIFPLKDTCKYLMGVK